MKKTKMGMSMMLVLVAGLLSLGVITGCDVDGPDNCNMNLPVSDTSIMMGDSVIAMARPECENITTELGLLTGEKYPDYAMSGAKMTGSNYYGYIPSIPSQWDDAKYDLPAIENVIMDGGGNDMLDMCSDSDLPLCESVVDAVVNDFVDLVDQMRADGVNNITYLALYETPGTMAKYIDSINYAMDLAGDLCSQIGVIFVDPREEFRGHPEYIKEDDTHPTHAGSIVLAGLIYDALISNSVIQ